MPVTSTLIENTPCLINSISVSNAYHLLEINNATSCPQEPISKQFYDPRYYTTNSFITNEFAVQTENQVLQLLNGLSGYNKPENVPDPTVK